MTTHEQPRSGAVLAGGGDGTGSIVRQGSAAGAWGQPRPILGLRGPARSCSRRWRWPTRSPSAATSRACCTASGSTRRCSARTCAAAGVRSPGCTAPPTPAAARRVREDGVLRRRPARRRRHGRLVAHLGRVLDPAAQPSRLDPGAVHAAAGPAGRIRQPGDAALLDSREPWALACATNPRRLRRVAPAVLDVRDLDALPAGLLDRLTPLLRAVTPPLCLPVAPGRRRRDLSGQRDGVRRTPLPPDRHRAAPPEQRRRPAPRDRRRLHRARHRPGRPAPLSVRRIRTRVVADFATTRRETDHSTSVVAAQVDDEREGSVR